MIDQNIAGYSFQSILDAQQGRGSPRPFGGPVTKSVTKPVLVVCFRCEMPFPLPVAAVTKCDTDPWPVQCTKCGYVHTLSDAKDAFWPIAS